MTKIKKGIVAISAVLLTAAAGFAYSAPAAHAAPSHQINVATNAGGGEGDWPVPFPS